MLFGYKNVNNNGKGIPKNQPRKKSFFRFFELFIQKFWKLIQINIIYFLFCLPVITFGPATAALAAITRRFFLEQPVFLFSDFWDAFKQNFKKSFLIGIADLFLISAYVYNLTYLGLTSPSLSDYSGFLAIITVCAGTFLLISHFYIYLQISAINLKLKDILLNSCLLVFLNAGRNIITLIVFICTAYFFSALNLYALFLLPFMPVAWIWFVITFNSYPAIQKYIINPFYEQNNLQNPEYSAENQSEPPIFADKSEEESKNTVKNVPKNKKGKKIIK